PIHISRAYAVSLSTAQLAGVFVILLLTWTNMRGIQYGRVIQNVFTTSKIAALSGVIAVGFIAGRNSPRLAANFSSMWTPAGYTPVAAGLGPDTAFGLFVALCVAQVGSLFSADAWNNITFTAGEVK